MFWGSNLAKPRPDRSPLGEFLREFNPLIPKSDPYVNSPYNFNTLSSRQVMRIKKITGDKAVFI